MTLEWISSVHARDGRGEDIRGRREPANRKTVAIEFVYFCERLRRVTVATRLSGAGDFQLIDQVVLLLEQSPPLEGVRPLMVEGGERNCALASGEEDRRGGWEERRPQDGEKFFQSFRWKRGSGRRALGGDIFVRGIINLAVLDIRVFICEPDSLKMIRCREHSRTAKEGIKPDRAWGDKNRVVVCG